jgi:hypothetical protein
MYKHIDKVTLPDGRELHVEMDERGNVRASLVFDSVTPPRGTTHFAWAALGSRAISREAWSREHHQLHRK